MSRPRRSTLIRTERKATAARKRMAYERQAHKKPGKEPGYNFSHATEAHPAPAAHRNTPNLHFEVSRHEIIG